MKLREEQIDKGTFSPNTISDEAIVRGDNGDRQVQESAPTIDDSGNIDLKTAGITNTDVTTPILVGESTNPIFNTFRQTILGALNEVLTNKLSAGYTIGGTITDNLDGTVHVGIGTGFIRISNNSGATLKTFGWPNTENLVLTDNASNYIYVDYNGGTPIVAAQVGGSGILDNENDKFELAEIYREGTDLHITQHRQYSNDAISRLQKRLYSISGLIRANGLVLGETGTRNVTLTAGLIWVKLDENNISAIDTSGAGSFTRYYRTGGVWTAVASQTQWDNVNYNDTSSGLVSMTNNRYSFQEFFVEPDGDFVSVYGDDEYVGLAAAENAPLITNLPPRLSGHSVYVGRIVFEEGGSVAEIILSPFGNSLASAPVTDHNILSNLTTGDVHIQYLLLAGRSGQQIDDDIRIGSGAPVSEQLEVDNNIKCAKIIITGVDTILPDGTSGTTQSVNDDSTKLATTAYADNINKIQVVTKSITSIAALTDNYKVVEFNNGASDLDFTIPLESSVNFPIGSWIVVRKIGSGEISFPKGGAMTYRSFLGDVEPKLILGDSSSVFLEKTGSDIWLFSGSIEAA